MTPDLAQTAEARTAATTFSDVWGSGNARMRIIFYDSIIIVDLQEDDPAKKPNHRNRRSRLKRGIDRRQALTSEVKDARG